MSMLKKITADDTHCGSQHDIESHCYKHTCSHSVILVLMFEAEFCLFVWDDGN